MEGKLVCPNCKREYPIVNGIPNMILNENEIWALMIVHFYSFIKSIKS